MATLVYNKLFNNFMLLHGNNSRTIIHYGENNKFNFIDKLDIPMWSEIKKLGENAFPTRQDFYNLLIKNKYDSSICKLKNIDIALEDNSNELKYNPIILFDNSLLVRASSLRNSTEKILKFFNIDKKDFEQMKNFMVKKGYSIIIIKNHIRLYVSPVENTINVFTLFQGSPLTKKLSIPWKERYDYDYRLNLKIPNYYKKYINVNYIGGDEGELFLTSFDITKCWPQFFHFETKIFNSLKEIKLITNYDVLASYTKEQKELLNSKIQ